MKSFVSNILKSTKTLLNSTVILIFIVSGSFQAFCQQRNFTISRQDFKDRVQAIWTAQMLGAMMGWPFEHKVASTEWIDKLNPKYRHAPVDDDWYYEMVAVRAFERYGVDMTIGQLGKQWLENSAGSWGSSEQARILMSRGILPPDCGHPKYNKLWFTIGPQFSSDVYGALAPGMPILAGKLARTYGHINGYGEAVDGAVFVAGMISIGFFEHNPQTIVREAAKLINSSSPYRRCLDLVIGLASEGKSSKEVFDAVEDRWHYEYPATNNAVANGGIVATSVWFGQGDFLKTINLAYGAADFTDADCNAADAAAAVGAMRGMKAFPSNLVRALNDSIVGDQMGKVALTPAVHETISGLAERTCSIGIKLLRENGVTISAEGLRIEVQESVAQPAELFSLSDLASYWNPEWTLARAGYGGAGGGMPGIRGITYLDGDVLATYPRDEVRGVELSREVRLQGKDDLYFEAGVDSGRTWKCEVYVNNKKMFEQLIENERAGRRWYPIDIDLSSFGREDVRIRLYQRVLNAGKIAGNAYWRNLEIKNQ